MVRRNERVLFVVVSPQKRQCQHFEMLHIVLQRCSLHVLVGNNVSDHPMKYHDKNCSLVFSVRSIHLFTKTALRAVLTVSNLCNKREY